MSREYFATKVMSGHREVHARTKWWPVHSNDLARFLLLSESQDKKATLSTRQILYTGAREWDEFMTGSAKSGPMADHVKLEAELVEAAIKTDLVRIEKTGALLTENIYALIDATVKKSPEIPVDRLRGLLAEHVHGFVESVLRFMDDDEKAFTECERRRAANTLALAVLTTELS